MNAGRAPDHARIGREAMLDAHLHRLEMLARRVELAVERLSVRVAALERARRLGEEWLSVREAAAVAGVCPRTVYNWLEAGAVESTRLPNGALRIRRDTWQRREGDGKVSVGDVRRTFGKGERTETTDDRRGGDE